MRPQWLSRALLIVALLAVARPVIAHSPLERSRPADAAVLTRTPDKLELVFRHPVHLASVVLSPAGGGDPIAVATGHMDKAIERYELPLPRLAPETYTVDWRALADDGHVMSGSFSFTLRTEASGT